MTAFEYIVKLANYKPLKHKNFVFCNVAVYDESLFTHRWYHCIIRLILLTVIDKKYIILIISGYSVWLLYGRIAPSHAWSYGHH